MNGNVIANQSGGNWIVKLERENTIEDEFFVHKI